MYFLYLMRGTIVKESVELSLEQLETKILNSNHYELLANHKNDILTLVNTCNISLQTLLELDSELLKKAIENIGDLVNLLKQDVKAKAKIVVEHFSKMHSIETSIEREEELFCNLNNSYIRLLTHLDIELVKTLLKLNNPLFQYELFTVPEAWYLIQELGLNIQDVEKMDLVLRDFLIDMLHLVAMNNYRNLGKISFQQLLEIVKKHIPKNSLCIGVPRGSAEANLFIRDLNKAAIDYKNMKNEVEKNASCLAYLQHDSTSLFSKLPPETLVKIATLMGDKDDVIVNDREFFDIAYNKF